MTHAELITSGKAWNDAIRARPGNPEREKVRHVWAPPRNRCVDQEALEAEREAERERDQDGPDPQVQAFLARCEVRHRAHWLAHPHGGGRGGQRTLFD